MASTAEPEYPATSFANLLRSGAVVKEGDMASQLELLGMEPVGEGPEAFAKMVQREVDTITQVVENAGLKPQ